MLPEEVKSSHRLDLPVIYKSEIRSLSDLHYGLVNEVYLKDNKGVSVMLSQLTIHEEWKKLYTLVKEREENDLYDPKLAIKIHKERSKLNI